MHLTKSKLLWAPATMMVLLFASCDDQGSIPEDITASDLLDVIPDTATPDPTTVDEDFRIIYGYTSVTATRPGEILIGMPNPEVSSNTPSWAADFRLADTLTSIGLDCTIGCWPARDMRLMAVATGTDSTTMGLNLQLVSFDADLNATPLLQTPVTGVRQARLSGHMLTISRFQPDCEALTGNPRTCFKFERLDFSEPTNGLMTSELFVFPPADLLADSMYTGDFRLGSDGHSLIIQNVQKDSVAFWIYDENDGLRQVGAPVCQAVDEVSGGCRYDSNSPDLNDDLPVALTKDGRYLLFAHVYINRELRLVKLDVETNEMTWTTLLHTPSAFTANACYNLKPSWRFTRIQQPMLIPGDGNELLFVAASECDLSLGKSLTDIIALPIEAIGAADWNTRLRNLTRFPARPVPGCVSILPDTLDVSDSGSYVVFGGTPALDSDGRPIMDESPQHFTDREVWVTDIDGAHAPVQITGNVNFKVSSVTCSVSEPWFAGTTDPEIADR